MSASKCDTSRPLGRSGNNGDKTIRANSVRQGRRHGPSPREGRNFGSEKRARETTQREAEGPELGGDREPGVGTGLITGGVRQVGFSEGLGDMVNPFIAAHLRVAAEPVEVDSEQDACRDQFVTQLVYNELVGRRQLSRKSLPNGVLTIGEDTRTREGPGGEDSNKVAEADNKSDKLAYIVSTVPRGDTQVYDRVGIA